MKRRKLSDERLRRYWETKLPGQAPLFDRLLRTGLLPRDHNLSTLELVCACSLMIECKSHYDVYKSIGVFDNEYTASRFDEVFFNQLAETIAGLELAGMRTQARKLRKLGHGLAFWESGSGWQSKWQSKWQKERDEKYTSAIKDEPFLPQHG